MMKELYEMVARTKKVEVHVAFDARHVQVCIAIAKVDSAGSSMSVGAETALIAALAMKMIAQ